LPSSWTNSASRGSASWIHLETSLSPRVGGRGRSGLRTGCRVLEEARRCPWDGDADGCFRGRPSSTCPSSGWGVAARHLGLPHVGCRASVGELPAAAKPRSGLLRTSWRHGAWRSRARFHCCCPSRIWSSIAATRLHARLPSILQGSLPPPSTRTDGLLLRQRSHARSTGYSNPSRQTPGQHRERVDKHRGIRPGRTRPHAREYNIAELMEVFSDRDWCQPLVGATH
jgi:hypothetical protein